MSDNQQVSQEMIEAGVKAFDAACVGNNGSTIIVRKTIEAALAARTIDDAPDARDDVERLLPHVCADALTDIRSLLRHSTDDAVTLVYEIDAITSAALSREPIGEVEAMRQVKAILDEAPELNMSNFDIDQVAALNSAMIEAWQIIDAALSPKPTAPKERSE